MNPFLIAVSLFGRLLSTICNLLFPDNTEVTGATLSLTPKRFDIRGTGVEEIKLFAMNDPTDMVETEVTWNQPADGASWSGGTFDAGSPLAIMPGYTDDSDTGRRTFASSDAFIQAVETALAKGSKSLEMIVVSPDTELKTGVRNFVGFWSDDAASAADRPVLTVHYDIPEPSTWIMLIALVAAWGWIARNRS